MGQNAINFAAHIASTCVGTSKMLWLDQASIGRRRTTCAVRGRNAGRRIRESWISAEHDRRRWREIDTPRSKPNKELDERENLMGERSGQWLIGEFNPHSPDDMLIFSADG
jgi:hypothetical protein